MEPRVFTIGSGTPFLPTLVEAILDGSVLDGRRAPEALAEATIYLPTRRAARAFHMLLGDALGGGAKLLPRVIPLGEADEAEFELSGGISDAALEAAEVLAPPIPPLERRLILTQLIQRWVQLVDRALIKLPADAPLLVPASPADAVTLAADLEGVMDAFATEDIPWEALAEAVEADYSTYFALTLDFVRIAAEAWPMILAERGASDPARRRSALIAAEARRLARNPPAAPVIAAGSTGSIPSTAALLAAIARLPQGAVILPGLDTDLDEPGWRAVGTAGADGSDLVHGHPQATLRRLLDGNLRMARSAVRALGPLSESASARSRLLSQALRPADTTERWAALDPSERAKDAKNGCEGIKLVEAADEREEALAAAIALREAIAEPGRIAALVTPDRGLAARVKAELARWGLAVEDSAGLLLSETPAGRLARLAADAAAHDFEPRRVLALLAHPDLRLGLARETLERAASALEIGVLRGPAPGRGIDGLRRALEHRRDALDRHTPRARRRLQAEDWALAADLLTRLSAAFGDFSAERFGEDSTDLVALADRHRQVWEALHARSNDQAGTDEGSGVDEVRALFDDLAAAETGGVRGRFTDYPAFFNTVARQRTVTPPPRATHRRLKILGLLEARLLTVDRVVLGGLDEGVWPPRVEADAFLNRPMRARIGLSPPERRIGQTAHDFVQALGVHDAVITRARKRDGSPMVPSRFLQRMQAFAGEAAWSGVVAGGERYRALARALDTPRPLPPLRRPAPKVDPALFPRTLSVTEIETLVRDPYSIFARHVLKLDALDPMAGVPGPAERGTIIHDILAAFAAAHPGDLPAHALEDLLARGQTAFGPIAEAYPELYAEWWPRFQRLASAFVIWERTRRSDIAGLYLERSGALAIPLPDGSIFTLRARADRLELGEHGRLTIIDYKTGSPPGLKEIYAGFAPQLTLEAAIAQGGGFKGVPAGSGTPDLLYIRTSGGRVPVDPRPVEPPPGETRSVAALVAAHRANLESLLARYITGKAAYLSRPFPKFARKYSEYDHLARVKEWSASSAGGGEDGGE